MALLFEAWEQDGKGQAQRHSLRSDAKGYTKETYEQWLAKCQDDPAVVEITKGRTDQQSDIAHTLWVRPGHKPLI